MSEHRDGPSQITERPSPPAPIRNEMSTMSPKQFRAALDKLDLSQVKAAALVGVDARTGRRWALGETTVPEAVAILLRLLVAKKISVRTLENLEDIP